MFYAHVIAGFDISGSPRQIKIMSGDYNVMFTSPWASRNLKELTDSLKLIIMKKNYFNLQG